MKRALNDRLLKSLKPAPAGKTYDVMDTIVPGFGVRVSGNAPNNLHAGRPLWRQQKSYAQL